MANILGRTARLECWPGQLQVGTFSEYIVSLLGSRGFWRTRKDQGYSHWSYLSSDRFFRPIIPFTTAKFRRERKSCEIRHTIITNFTVGRDTKMADNQIWKCPWRHVKTKNCWGQQRYCPCKKKEKRDPGPMETCCNPFPRTINQAEHSSWVYKGWT